MCFNPRLFSDILTINQPSLHHDTRHPPLDLPLLLSLWTLRPLDQTRLDSWLHILEAVVLLRALLRESRQLFLLRHLLRPVYWSELATQTILDEECQRWKGEPRQRGEED